MRGKHIAAALVLGVVAGSGLAVAGTTGWTSVPAGYYINESSFTPEALEGPIGRVTQFSGLVWSRSGTNAVRHEYGGTANTVQGCNFATANHIWANTGCDPSDTTPCNTFAWTDPWCPWKFWGSGWEIRVFLGSASFKITPTTTSEINLPYILQHELGHIFAFNHTPDNTTTPSSGPNVCIMNPGAGHSNSMRNLDGPCAAEIEAGASYHPRDVVMLMQSTQWPLPSGTSWTTPTQVAPYYGNGFGAAVRGTVAPAHDRDSFFYFDTSDPTHHVKTCDYAAGNPNCVFLTSTSLSSFSKAPAVAYDHTRKKWWFFGSDIADNISVPVFSSFDRVSFTDWGFAQDSSGTRIVTKNPVAAAYNPANDRILVAYTRNDGATVPPCTNGCVGDVNVVSFPAGSTGSLSWGPLVSFTSGATGHSGAGSPALACDNNVWIQGNCMVVVTGRDINRLLLNWTFDQWSDGSLRSFTAPALMGGGATDMTPSIAVQDPRVGGAWVVAVRGVDGYLYLNQKQYVFSSWSGWYGVGQTSQAPLIVSRMGAGSYDLLYAP